MRYRRSITTTSLFCLLSTMTWAAEPVSWLPSDINAVARINVADIYKTPLAKKEAWIKKASEAFIQQEAFVPPGTTQIIVAADLDLSEDLVANRKYAVLVPEGQLTLEKLSAWMPGGIETLSGKKMSHYGNDGYVVDAGDGCWLISASSSRQQISKWIKTGPSKSGNHLSKFLTNALNAKNSPQVLFAIDLHDNFSPARIAEQLKQADWIESPSTADSVAKVLETVQGLTIGIAINEDRVGTATLTFDKNTNPLKPVLDKLIESIVQRVGISSDDVDGWKWSLKDN
ncbi:MAG: hypothetical protein FJ267_08895, partial [Planctomycetes bacterium]|nr:hypothetical protein [Planctomycetota bacterium]